MEEIILNKFAERFTLLIKNSSIEISTLAEKLGLTKSTIYRYMNGEMAPKISTVKYAAEIFNVNPTWLMGYDVTKERDDFRYASYDGIDLEGLSEEDIKEINNFVDYIRNKKKNGEL